MERLWGDEPPSRGGTRRQVQQRHQAGKRRRRGPAARFILILDGHPLRPSEVKTVR
jgi:hypothetical protein